MSNLLLASLPAGERERLAPFLCPEVVPNGTVLIRNGETIENVWFLDEGVCVTVQVEADGTHIPSGMSGLDGMAGFEVWLRQERSSLSSIAYIGGRAQRMRADDLRREVIARPSPLNHTIADFVFQYISLASQLSACNRRHSLEERLCRWLTMITARVPSPARFPLSAARIADLLATERSTANITARILRNAGLIDLDEDHIRVLDAQGLADGACECMPFFRAAMQPTRTFSA